MTVWRFEHFQEKFNQWVDDDDPPEEFKFWVQAWFARLVDDPKADAAPAERLGHPWWFCKIPGADNDHLAVVCLYSIDSDDLVKCSGITTLTKPI